MLHYVAVQHHFQPTAAESGSLSLLEQEIHHGTIVATIMLHNTSIETKRQTATTKRTARACVRSSLRVFVRAYTAKQKQHERKQERNTKNTGGNGETKRGTTPPSVTLKFSRDASLAHAHDAESDGALERSASAAAAAAPAAPFRSRPTVLLLRWRIFSW